MNREIVGWSPPFVEIREDQRFGSALGSRRWMILADGAAAGSIVCPLDLSGIDLTLYKNPTNPISPRARKFIIEDATRFIRKVLIEGPGHG